MELLSREGFEARLEKELEKRYPDQWRKVDSVVKINQVKKAILLKCSGGVDALVYPEELYRAYEETESMDTVLEIIESAVENKIIGEVAGMVRNWNVAKNYVKPFVMNLKNNQTCIEKNDYVYQERLDLAYGCYIDLPHDVEGGKANVLISKGLLKYWGVSEKEIFENALKNEAYGITPIRAILQAFGGDVNVDMETKEDDAMFVLSNTRKYRGAAGMFDTELLQEKAMELDCNFYVLPCSMHEAILLKESAAPCIEAIREMVEEINRTQVSPEDYLSDSVYMYRRDENKISIVA